MAKQKAWIIDAREVHDALMNKYRRCFGGMEMPDGNTITIKAGLWGHECSTKLKYRDSSKDWQILEVTPTVTKKCFINDGDILGNSDVLTLIEAINKMG